jgi:hypothetical protein
MRWHPKKVAAVGSEADKSLALRLWREGMLFE